MTAATPSKIKPTKGKITIVGSSASKVMIRAPLLLYFKNLAQHNYKIVKAV